MGLVALTGLDRPAMSVAGIAAAAGQRLWQDLKEFWHAVGLAASYRFANSKDCSQDLDFVRCASAVAIEFIDMNKYVGRFRFNRPARMRRHNKSACCLV